ncbi:exonuclease SbcC [Sporomusaceae bacterium BoRhaA]|uniref:AAA family ATPase n=1 Tax=Pelorhabdus rhamnosifermentans TaxID=2772457 RepID=UPI001C061676|nr:SMC family ATPase [Pelorhabdus rhamnosifermentans]MBU2701544.1 exonuclease SbcC [Pelorhabdus rhamnosifermentans]
MKPLKLKMTAFGPYAKEQVIDFTELGAHQLFVITGDTGAGKTTILDAISYALYGRASGRDRDNDSLRSHFAEFDLLTSVELDFEIGGERYWIRRLPKQQKAKSRGTGFTEQNAEAELKFFDGQTSVIAGVTEVNNKMIALMGLTYEQFKQIIMIPQGEFRELLTADSKARQDILQKIFGTESLRRIQELLENKATALTREVAVLSNQRDEFIRSIDGSCFVELQELLARDAYAVPAVLAALTKAIASDEAAAQKLQAGIVDKEKALADKQAEIFRGREINGKLLERDEALQKKQYLVARQTEIEHKKNKLTNGRRALNLQTVDRECQSRNRVVQDKKNQLEKAQSQVVAAVAARNEAEQLYRLEKDKEAEKNNLLAEMTRLEGLRAKVADWDVRQRQVVTLQSKLIKVKQDKEKAEILLQENRTKLMVCQDDLNKAQADAVKFVQLTLALTEATERYTKVQMLEQENKQLGVLRLIYSQGRHEENEKRKDYEQAQLNYEAAQRVFLEGQAGQLAARLISGQPCPVCGSIEHVRPAVMQGNIPDDLALKKLKKVEKTAQAAWEKVNQKYQQAQVRGKSQKEIVERLKQELDALVDEDLSSLDKEQLTSYLANTVPKLKERMTELSRLREKLAAHNKPEQALRDQLIKINSDILDMEKQVTTLGEEYTQAFSEFQSTQILVENLSGELEPAIRSTAKLEQAIQQIKSQFDLLKSRLEQAEQRMTASKVDYAKKSSEKEGALATVAEAQNEVELAEKRFLAALVASGFDGKDDYEQAKLDESAIQALDKEIAAYYEELRSVQDHWTHLEQQVAGLHVVLIEQLEVERLALETEKSRLSELRTTVWTRKSLNQKLFERIIKLNTQIEKQEEQHQLIGHLARIAKGDNAQKVSFERYVLAAFFNDIIHAANIRLDTMTGGRYRMNRIVEKGKGSGQSGLEIEVFDYYTGQARHVKTLSGGESFKASLALALGLAEVVQSYAGGVSLETMFVDEGFGTLDPESLDQAIQCLVDLQHSGRLVGIISHVPELRASVDARLEIEAGKDGSSAHFCVL